ncbi:sodium-translocating pyrophosphatase [Candidatus Saccharibacteria bacterium]|nr:sodium-translocating pyrophosphatase [Candidatus Saccharibacteria bacterium]
MEQIIMVVLLVVVAAISMALKNYFNIRRPKKISDKDNNKELLQEMQELSEIIREGAKTFMITEYKIIVPVVLTVAALFSMFIEKTAGLTFLLGACMSSAACVLGMNSAVYANFRVARRALRSFDDPKIKNKVGRTVRTALKGGSISGLSVEAFGILGIAIILLTSGGIDLDATSSGFLANLVCNPITMRLTTYSLGCSLVAMFNRVAGGNYTKAADISADIVGKVRNDLPEDDSRMPNTIADFIGDNVNDIAGNCSDLLESFVATIVACLLLAGTVYRSAGEPDIQLYLATLKFPIALAGIGLLSCIIGLTYSLYHKNSDNPSLELDMATYISAAITILGSAGAASYFFNHLNLYDAFKIGWASPWVAAILGILSGVAVGKITEYYTGTEYKPVKELASFTTEGEAFVVTKGDAIGSRSVLLPCVVIGISLIASWALCGIYGIAVAALGMLSFVATTVSIDAFGPIADNAGGIAEGCHLPEEIRKITDKLDAVGNTTAAIGKGFAIGSAAYATVSLIFAYVGSYSHGEAVLNIASPLVIVGAIIGGALVEYFSAMLTDNTIESAKLLADAGAEQLTPEVLAGTARPDYNMIIEMASKQALKKMLIPSLLALLIPAFGMCIFGVEFVGGMLVGATVVAIPRAIFMGNSGGAWDNAKKFVEAGLLEGYGKGSAAHKAAVVGDTIGDTRKDVVGVALDIFIKTMSTVANTLAPVFVNMHLF